MKTSETEGTGIKSMLQVVVNVYCDVKYHNLSTPTVGWLNYFEDKIFWGFHGYLSNLESINPQKFLLEIFEAYYLSSKVYPQKYKPDSLQSSKFYSLVNHFTRLENFVLPAKYMFCKYDFVEIAEEHRAWLQV